MKFEIFLLLFTVLSESIKRINNLIKSQICLFFGCQERLIHKMVKHVKILKINHLIYFYIVKPFRFKEIFFYLKLKFEGNKEKVTVHS